MAILKSPKPALRVSFSYVDELDELDELLYPPLDELDELLYPLLLDEPPL